MDLYREVLLENYKNKANRGKLENPSISKKSSNPLCGDSLELDIKIEDGVVKDIKFDGAGCAVSVAATSMLIDKVIGKRVEDVRKITKEDLINEINPNLTLSRIKCATLGYNSLMEALSELSTEK
jgi:nitrogen fixation NifU-like protein